MHDKLIIFDYSGTLSLEAVAFSLSDSLIKHLQKSGLFELGVDSTALFWEVVNATWPEGSTTRLGYKAVMHERIAELFPEKAITKQQQIFRAVANFVEAYLDHSRIDEHWRLILQKLTLDKSLKVIIATDHYAEATHAIIKYLGQWDIQAVPLTADAKSNFFIANSADIGMHKAQQQFWQMVNNTLQLNFNRILLIDDFGQNEQQDDAYSNPERIDRRRKMTVEILHAVFASHVESIPFVVQDKHIKELIAGTSALINQFLAEGI
ncbi:MAG: hypothetical protein AB2L12_16490 [Smithellaceae bacterium]